MNSSPNATRLHVAIYGCRNSGKSSLINAITGEETSIVSPIAGTTTDTVARSMELHGIGAVLFIDTPGFDDSGEIGGMRVERTRRTTQRTDIAFLLCNSVDLKYEREWLKELRASSVPVVPIISKIDAREDLGTLAQEVEKLFGESPILLSVKDGVDIDVIREAILGKLDPNATERKITAGLVEKGDVVVLVMPQDPQAPKGRIILPQVQTLRELLDIGAIAISCTTEALEATLKTLSAQPKLIITDSQAFREVYAHKPPLTLLSSFSILMAAYKGDIVALSEGAQAIELLTPQSKVLIAEACAHAPMAEDIGRVKLPRMLRQRVGEELTIDIVSGRNFPEDLSSYSLIIHCGACMFNRKYMMHRIEKAKAAAIPITNYGVVIAYIQGLDLSTLSSQLSISK
ncbi:MAG: [FeFe] hydrogenase H-cluster maturation GTPase HydF [Rikenellaceae bacterium]